LFIVFSVLLFFLEQTIQRTKKKEKDRQYNKKKKEKRRDNTINKKKRRTENTMNKRKREGQTIQ
jgi:flagellar biosynthesis component FlhA